MAAAADGLANGAADHGSNHTDHSRIVIAVGQRSPRPCNSRTPQHHQDHQLDQQREQQLRASREQLLRDCRHDCLALFCFTAAIAGVLGGMYLLDQATTDAERRLCTVLGQAQCVYEKPRGKPPYSRGYLPRVKVQFGAQEFCDFNAGNDRERGEESSEADCFAWVVAHPNGACWVHIHTYIHTRSMHPRTLPIGVCASSSCSML